MSEQHPLHALRNELEVLRERAIEKLAASEGRLTTNALQGARVCASSVGCGSRKKRESQGEVSRKCGKIILGWC